MRILVYCVPIVPAAVASPIAPGQVVSCCPVDVYSGESKVPDNKRFEQTSGKQIKSSADCGKPKYINLTRLTRHEPAETTYPRISIYMWHEETPVAGTGTWLSLSTKRSNAYKKTVTVINRCHRRSYGRE